MHLNLIYFKQRSVTFRFNAVMVQILARFFCRYWQADSKILWKGKWTLSVSEKIEKEKVENWYYPILRLNIKLQMASQCILAKG